MEGAALKEAKRAFFDKRKTARKEKNAKKRKSRKVDLKEKITADQPARWPWESPPHSCRVRKVVSVSVRKKGRGRKRHTVPRARGRGRPTQQTEAASSAAATTRQEALKERVAEVVAATMGVMKAMTHPSAALGLGFQPRMHARGPEPSPREGDNEPSPSEGDNAHTQQW